MLFIRVNDPTVVVYSLSVLHVMGADSCLAYDKLITCVENGYLVVGVSLNTVHISSYLENIEHLIAM